MISTEAIIGDATKDTKPNGKQSSPVEASRNTGAAPHIPIEEIMRQIDASDERDRVQLQDAQRRMGDELWRIALEMDLQVLAKREIKALKEVPDDVSLDYINQSGLH